MVKRYVWSFVAVLLAVDVALLPIADACTSFRVVAKDGSIVVGRSLEGGAVFGGEIGIFPRNYAFAARLPGKKSGMEWKTKYGFVRALQMGHDDAAPLGAADSIDGCHSIPLNS